MKKHFKIISMFLLCAILLTALAVAFAGCDSDMLVVGKDFNFVSANTFDVSESLTLKVEIIDENLKNEKVSFFITNNSSTNAILTDNILTAFRPGTISMRLTIGSKHYDFAVTVTDRFEQQTETVVVRFSQTEYSLGEGEIFSEKAEITINGEKADVDYQLIFLSAIAEGYIYDSVNNSVTFLKSGSYRFYAAVSVEGVHYTSLTITVKVSKETGKEFSFDGYSYIVYKTYAVLSGYSGDSATVSVPQTISINLDGMLTTRTVTKIASQAFYSNRNIQEVILSESINEIGAEAFAYSTLEKINIPASVIQIGTDAFSASALVRVDSLNSSFYLQDGCYIWQTRLIKCVSTSTQVNVPYVNQIDSYAFYQLNQVESIEMPTSLSGATSDAYANISKVFVSMDSLKSVTFLGGSYYLNADAFLNCSQVRYLNLTGLKGVSSDFTLCGPTLAAPNGAQCYLPALSHIVYPSEFYFTDLFEYEAKPLIDLTVEFSEGSTSIPLDAFYGGEECIKTLILPASMAYAQAYRRQHEGDDYEYNLPIASLIRLESVQVAEGNSVYKSIDGALYTYDNSTGAPQTLVHLPRKMPLVSGTYTVAEGTQTIGLYASFMKTSGTGNADYDLINVILPSSVKTIDSYAFRGCSYLQSIEMPAVETISMEAFAACRSLSSVTLPQSLTAIGNRAFRYCRSLSQIILLCDEPPAINDFDWIVADVKANSTPIEKYLYIFKDIAKEYSIKVKNVSVFETHRLWKLYEGHYEALE